MSKGTFVRLSIAASLVIGFAFCHPGRLSAAEPGSGKPGASRSKMPSPATFSLARIQRLRKQARQAREIPERVLDRIPNGWSKSLVDPMRVLAAFDALKLKDGYVLRAYQFKEGGNGNGVVWALPKDAKFPDPKTLIQDHMQLFKSPKPSKAMDNFMEPVRADRSAWSFMSASLLRRELDEFGAMWHGCNWTMHSILADDPWNPNAQEKPRWEIEGPSKPVSKWKWHAPKPTDWRPRLTVKGDVVTVTFYTYSPMGKEAIYKQVDEFRPGEYRFTTETTKIATGPRQIAF